MSNLLSAYFSRLWKEKIFWLALAFLAGDGILMTLVQFVAPSWSTGNTYVLEDFCFNFHPVIGVASAVVVCLFLGREYQDGTLRNKLIAGYNRWKIYLAGLVINVLSALWLALGYSAAACILGIPAFGGFQSQPGTVLLLLLSNTLCVIAYASIFTMIQMLVGSRAAGVVICILLALGLYLLGNQLHALLKLPEYWPEQTYWNEFTGEMVTIPPQPVPDYFDHPCRPLLKFFYEFLPSSQGQILTSQGSLFLVKPQANLEHLSLYSLLLITITTGAGLLGFRNKRIS